MTLEALLQKLKMDHLEAQLDTLCEQAAQREVDYKTFLAEALQVEWQGAFSVGLRHGCASHAFLE